MNKKTASLFKAAMTINAAVGLIWIGIGLRDLFAPHLFRFDGRVADTSTIVLDFVVGAIFLVAAFSFLQARSRDVAAPS